MKIALKFYLLLILPVLSLAAQCEPTTPLPPEANKPQVTLISPPNNATVSLGDAVPVRALIKDATGVLRVDFVVDGGIVDSKSLVFASVQYDYQYSWKPIVLGTRNISVIAYNSRNVVSDPATARVNVVTPSPTPTPRAPTATSTPNVIVVTPTPANSPTVTPTWTPRVVVITTTPPATRTATRTPTFTQTPFLIVVTDTPKPTATPTRTATGTQTPAP